LGLAAVRAIVGHVPSACNVIWNEFDFNAFYTHLDEFGYITKKLFSDVTSMNILPYFRFVQPGFEPCTSPANANKTTTSSAARI
jgi:hypothetical protein